MGVVTPIRNSLENYRVYLTFSPLSHLNESEEFGPEGIRGLKLVVLRTKNPEVRSFGYGRRGL